METIKLNNFLKLFIKKNNEIFEFDKPDFLIDLQGIFPNLIIKNILNKNDLQNIIENEYENIFEENLDINEFKYKIYKLNNINKISDINLKIELIKLLNQYNLINLNYEIYIKFEFEK